MEASRTGVEDGGWSWVKKKGRGPEVLQELAALSVLAFRPISKEGDGSGGMNRIKD